MHFNEGISMCWSHDALGIDCGSVDAAKIVSGCDTRKREVGLRVISDYLPTRESGEKVVCPLSNSK